ncbi:unnamed protein product [Spirodela intermedia]|uniref:YqaJ viral recombinase domain-containing protein n=1 Tax=Spirodela intermedia TaxID=51605 RepID=A0A7I8L6I2_SPIIN|nr:unnamed protein product [Spirodela intermedia]
MTHACFPSSRALPLKTGYYPTRLLQTRVTTTLIVTSSSSSSSLPQQLLLRCSSPPVVNPPFDGPQRSSEWFALRRDKLTTSTFSTALGFWKGNRRSELWHQKVFSPDADTISSTGRAAMEWGVDNEAAAIERYRSITGREVGTLGFAMHADASFAWMGASPDGVLGRQPEGGILEVKCPFNKGRPELGLPWRAVPYYYMPQVQGQMEIMDRDWVDLYCWTPNGSSLFRVFREKEYWELMHAVLREFWWENVLPAREALAAGREAAARALEPEPGHELTGLVVARSQKLAAAARLLCKEVAGHVEFFG